MKHLITPTKLLSLLALSVFISSCSDEETKPEDKKENEVITTVVINARSDSHNTTAVYRPENQPGKPRVFDTLFLDSSKTYNFSLEILDESKAGKVDTITKEIRAESQKHQFFWLSNPSGIFSFNTGTPDFDNAAPARPLALTYSNVLFNGRPGVNNQTLRLILKHDLNKAGANVANNDPTNAGGSTDVEAIFPVKARR